MGRPTSSTSRVFAPKCPVIGQSIAVHLSFLLRRRHTLLSLSALLMLTLLLSLLPFSLWQAKEAQVSKDMEELRSAEPDSPVFKLLEQVWPLIRGAYTYAL